MKNVPTSRNLIQAIRTTWQAIGHDAMSSIGEDYSQPDAVEFCFDFLETYGEYDDAMSDLHKMIDAFGYNKTLATLSAACGL